MTNKEKKSNVKKKDLVREVNKESEEKWKGLENKVWTVAEFGFYVILMAFTIFAVGYRSSALMNSKNGYVVNPDAKYIESGYDTVYYDIANQCEDLDDCIINSEVNYQNSSLVIDYVVQNGLATLDIGDFNISIDPINEFAVLKNGYIATFATGSESNIITYYDTNGDLVKEFETKLTSSGKLDSNVGVYAVCNNKKLDVVKYTIQSDGNFFEELIGSENSDQC